MEILQQSGYLFLCNTSLPVSKFLLTSRPNPATYVHCALFYHLPLLGRVWLCCLCHSASSCQLLFAHSSRPLHQTKLTKFPQFFLIIHAFLLPDHLGCPPLDLPQFLNIPVELENLNWIQYPHAASAWLYRGK